MNRTTLQLAALAALLAASPALAGSVRLRASATAEGPRVTLGEVAQLEGEDAAALAGTVVGSFKSESGETTLTLAAVRDRLGDANIHWGRVSLGGYASCRISRSPKPSPSGAGPAASEPVGPAIGAEAAVTSPTATSLRDQITRDLARLSGVSIDNLRVKLSGTDAEALDAAPAAGDRYEIEPQSVTGLGRVPVVVRRWSGDRQAETLRLTADASRRGLAIVAKRGVARGQTFTADDVEVREVELDTPPAADAAPPDLARVVGRECAGTLREGTVVLPAHVRSPLVVKRGELVTIRCLAGALVIRTVARAAEDGAVDQTIQVRNERSRESYPVRVTGPQEGVLSVAADRAVGSAKIDTDRAGNAGTGGADRSPRAAETARTPVNPGIPAVSAAGAPVAQGDAK